MRWIYLSPHFDDAALSCGGMIWEQVQAGETVEIWTLFAGYPPRGLGLSAFAAGKHVEWGIKARSAVHVRRGEDRTSNRRLGAGLRWWNQPDCIYRRLPDGEAVITYNDALWLPVHPGELGMIPRLRAWLRRHITAEDRLVCPLTLGNHLDHRIVRTAAESLRRSLYYYADYPYIARQDVRFPLGLSAQQLYRCEITPGGLLAWQESVAAHASQVPDLFGSQEAMREELRLFKESGGGSFLWYAPVEPGHRPGRRT
jgi:LmbE family N-acetylglucosaminyl deacetylase